MRHSVVVARSYADALSRAPGSELEANDDPLRCGQEPGDRSSWLERGYCDLPRLGPGRVLPITASIPGTNATTAKTSSVAPGIRRRRIGGSPTRMLPARPSALVSADGEPFGTWYGVLGETLVTVSPVRAPGSATTGVLFRWARSTGAGGAVYPMKSESGQVTFTLPNRSIITMRRGSGSAMTATWQGAEAGQSNFSVITGGAATRLQGELQRAPDDL